jgi:DNA polymerase III subunit epsilon
MRKIILDTETTGLSKASNRIIEIGAIETFDNIPSGAFFHTYLNPGMLVSEESYKICGLSNEFLQDKQSFQDIVQQLDIFIGDDPIVAHNATFDINFLNMERELIGLTPLQNEVIDTLKIARKVFLGLPCSLDALCKRFKINLNKRNKHGALIDAELLAKVYFYLLEKQSDAGSLLEIDNNCLIQEVNFQRSPIIIYNQKDEEEHIKFLCVYKLDNTSNL